MHGPQVWSKSHALAMCRRQLIVLLSFVISDLCAAVIACVQAINIANVDAGPTGPAHLEANSSFGFLAVSVACSIISIVVCVYGERLRLVAVVLLDQIAQEVTTVVRRSLHGGSKASVHPTASGECARFGPNSR